MRNKLCLDLLCYLEFMLLILLVTSATAENLNEDKICATLYSDENWDGDKFILGDHDQSVNTQKDYRSLIDGWGNTSSIRVEENCTLSACTGTYYEGECQSYPPGDHRLSSVHSASCSCSRNCKCEDVIILKNDDTCGRAYVNGTCNECDAEYLPLYKHHDFYSGYEDLVKAIAIRSGCHLTIYTQKSSEGDSRNITGPIVEDFQGRIGSYECICDDDAYIPLERVTLGGLVPFSIKLPKTGDELLDMISTNMTMAQHPGLLAAKASLQSGRSHQNAYILVIGAYYPENVGIFLKCTDNYSKIWECHVALDVPEIGIMQTQVRVIWAYFDSGNDAQWVATLDQYLSTHEELKDSIPNAVIVYHWPMKDATIAQNGSIFQKKLAGINALRGRLLDDKFSNLVIAAYDHYRVRNPETAILAIEAAINENWNLPKPTSVFPVYDDYSVPKVNGYSKGRSGEYYFRNIYRALILAAEKGGDALGHAIFKAAFPVAETEWAFVQKNGVNLLPENDTLELRVTDLEGKMNILQCQITDLSKQINATITENENLKRQSQELKSQINATNLANFERIKAEVLNAVRVDLNNRLEQN